MFQPIPPIAVPPPVAAPPSSAVAPGGLDVASGPLPQATASESSAFGDAIRAGKVQDVRQPGPHAGNRVWNDAGHRLGSTLDGMNAQDAMIRKMMHDHASGPGADGGEAGRAAGIGDDLPQDSASVMKWGLEENAKILRESLSVAQFVITTDLASNGAKDVTGAVKQLANGGNG